MSDRAIFKILLRPIVDRKGQKTKEICFDKTISHSDQIKETQILKAIENGIVRNFKNKNKTPEKLEINPFPGIPNVIDTFCQCNEVFHKIH